MSPKNRLNVIILFSATLVWACADYEAGDAPDLDALATGLATQPLVTSFDLTVSIDAQTADEVTFLVDNIPATDGYTYLLAGTTLVPPPGYCIGSNVCMDINWNASAPDRPIPGLNFQLHDGSGQARFTFALSPGDEYFVQGLSAMSWSKSESLAFSAAGSAPVLNVLDIAVGQSTGCAIVENDDTGDHSVECWGVDNQGSLNDAPADVGHYFGLTGNDDVFCVGYYPRLSGPYNDPYRCWGAIYPPTEAILDAELTAQQLHSLSVTLNGEICGISAATTQVHCVDQPYADGTANNPGVQPYTGSNYFQVVAGAANSCANTSAAPYSWECAGGGLQSTTMDPSWYNVSPSYQQVCGMRLGSWDVTCSGTGYPGSGVSTGFQLAPLNGYFIPHTLETTNYNVCALDSSGVAVCDGRADLGINTPPTSPLITAEVGSSGGVACGVTTDARVECWGILADYQLGAGAPPSSLQ